MYDPNTAILTAVVSQHRQNLAQESGGGDVVGATAPDPDRAGIQGGLLVTVTGSLTTLGLTCACGSELATNLD